jgi:hypothetical protein
LTGNVLQQFAYDAAPTNNMLHRFTHTDQMAGDSFYYELIALYPEISLRQPKLLLWSEFEGFGKKIMFYNTGKICG